MVTENPQFLTDQLITYLGNKRALLSLINEGIVKVKTSLNQSKIKTLDLFSGSGVVSRALKEHSSLLISNDLEEYSKYINLCYLENNSNRPKDLPIIYNSIIQVLKTQALFSDGFINKLYSPKDDTDISKDDRCFFTNRNAKYLDTARQLIGILPKEYQPYLIGPLLSEASIHANTSGVFKGFYKNANGIGQFGGEGKNALKRICSDMHLRLPVVSNFDCDILLCQEDANTLVSTLPEVDMAYLDPPYNQHPYGSNYFMLNLIASYKEPTNISKVSGIPENWNKSIFNNKKETAKTFETLLNNIKAKYVLISFSDDGFISKSEMLTMCQKLGSVEVLEQKYNTFRGSKNLNNRSIHVKEFLYIVEKN